MTGHTHTPLKVQMVLLLALLLVAGCGPSAAPPAAPAATAAVPTQAATNPPVPTVGSTLDTSSIPTVASTPNTAPAPTVAATAQPVPGMPVALRDDITIRKILETGGGFVRLDIDPLTNTLYTMDPSANISSLDVGPDNTSKRTLVYSRVGIGAPLGFVASGMAFGPDGALYVVGNITQGNLTRAVIRKGTPDAAGTRAWSTLAETEPYQRSNTQFDHLFNGIVASPDGQYVYVNSGSRTDHGEVESAGGAFPDMREVALTSAIFRIPTDSANQVLPNDAAQLQAKGYLFAEGVRNSYDLAFAPNGDLFAGDNGPDADFPDEFNWLQEGHDYGFPWRLGNFDNPQRTPGYDPSKDGRLRPEFFAIREKLYQDDPGFPAPPNGVTFTDPLKNLGPDGDVLREIDGNLVDAGDQGQAIHTFTPHRSPLGLVFDTANALAGDLKGDALILSWGVGEGSMPDPGQDLLHLKLTKVGETYQAQITQLVAGFDRPIDGVLLGDKLYVLDMGGRGVIWEVTLPAL